ncbi:MAG: hypothetical protein ABIO67_00810, partial [Mycobacteriales bacterium]
MNAQHVPRPLRLWALAAAALVLTGACGGSDAGQRTPAAGVPATKAAQPAALTVDPCTLLTVAEMETALGRSGVVRDTSSPDVPGSCSFSLDGDIGSGAVRISLGDPLICSALQ